MKSVTGVGYIEMSDDLSLDNIIIITNCGNLDSWIGYPSGEVNWVTIGIGGGGIEMSSLLVYTLLVYTNAIMNGNQVKYKALGKLLRKSKNSYLYLLQFLQ